MLDLGGPRMLLACRQTMLLLVKMRVLDTPSRMAERRPQRCSMSA
jgi:hypothetical protein